MCNHTTNRRKTDASRRGRKITKAHQTAQLLAADLREAHAKTDNVAAEIVLLDMIEQVERISQRLNRLAAAETP